MSQSHCGITVRLAGENRRASAPNASLLAHRRTCTAPGRTRRPGCTPAGPGCRRGTATRQAGCCRRRRAVSTPSLRGKRLRSGMPAGVELLPVEQRLPSACRRGRPLTVVEENELVPELRHSGLLHSVRNGVDFGLGAGVHEAAGHVLDAPLRSHRVQPAELQSQEFAPRVVIYANRPPASIPPAGAHGLGEHGRGSLTEDHPRGGTVPKPLSYAAALAASARAPMTARIPTPVTSCPAALCKCNAGGLLCRTGFDER